MNKVELIGRLTADPELRKTNAGLSVTSFHLAVERRSKEKKTDFIPVAAYDNRAEFISKYFKKGQRMGIVGTIRMSEWEKDGKKMQSFNVMVDEVDFCDSKTESKFTSADDEELPF